MCKHDYNVCLIITRPTTTAIAQHQARSIKAVFSLHTHLVIMMYIMKYQRLNVIHTCQRYCNMGIYIGVYTILAYSVLKRLKYDTKSFIIVQTLLICTGVFSWKKIKSFSFDLRTHTLLVMASFLSAEAHRECWYFWRCCRPWHSILRVNQLVSGG